MCVMLVCWVIDILSSEVELDSRSVSGIITICFVVSLPYETLIEFRASWPYDACEEFNVPLDTLKEFVVSLPYETLIEFRAS